MCNFIALFRWLPLLLRSRGLFGVLGTKTSFLSFLEPVLNRSQELQTKTNTSNRTRKKIICINQKLMILLDFFLKMLFFSKKLFLNVRFGIFVFVFSSWDLFFWKLDFKYYIIFQIRLTVIWFFATHMEALRRRSWNSLKFNIVE